MEAFVQQDLELHPPDRFERVDRTAEMAASGLQKCCSILNPLRHRPTVRRARRRVLRVVPNHLALRSLDCPTTRRGPPKKPR